MPLFLSYKFGYFTWNKFTFSTHLYMCKFLLAIKELHSGGNYPYIPILNESLSQSQSTHDKTALWNHTVPRGFLSSSYSRSSWHADSMLQCGHADDLWIVSILIGWGFFSDCFKPKNFLLLIFWIPAVITKSLNSVRITF